jgi:predicted methyltransferase
MQMVKWIAGIAACSMLIACGAESAPRDGKGSKASPAVPAYVAAAIADPGRNAQRFDDGRRKPVEIVTFSGVKPGDKVLDLIPGDGYWTRIFSKIVGPKGHVYAVWPQNYARYSEAKVAIVKGLAASPVYPNVTVDIQPTPILSSPEKLDVMFTSQNYHDYPDEYMGNTDPSILNKAVFGMLKPGGLYIVIDHAAAPGSGMRDTPEMHRIDPATVRQQVEAAGFEYVGENDALRNPDDPHTAKVFDPSIRGKTDKFAFKFRKPAR